jgi:PIN domain nuclease of toxin-antitoxin system
LRLLLDTHAFLWFVTDDPHLSRAALVAITSADNQVCISPASYWELAIKVSIGKYPLDVPFETFITNAIDGNRFQIIPIMPQHAAEVSTLPYHHRDPFDRLMIAQSIVERMTIVSADEAFDDYPITRLW